VTAPRRRVETATSRLRVAAGCRISGRPWRERLGGLDCTGTMSTLPSAAFRCDPDDQAEIVELVGPPPFGPLAGRLSDGVVGSTVAERFAISRRQQGHSATAAASLRPTSTDLIASAVRSHVDDDFMPVRLTSPRCDVVSMLPVSDVTSGIHAIGAASGVVARQWRGNQPHPSPVGEFCATLSTHHC